MTFCTNCGKKLIDGAKFCVFCGHAVAPAKSSTAQSTSPESKAINRAPEQNITSASANESAITASNTKQDFESAAEYAAMFSKTAAIEAGTAKEAIITSDISAETVATTTVPQGEVAPSEHREASAEETAPPIFPSYAARRPESVASTLVDNPGFWWAFLGFCVPIAGLILFISMRKTTPKRAKCIGIATLIRACAETVVVLFYAVLLIIGAIGMMETGELMQAFSPLYAVLL